MVSRLRLLSAAVVSLLVSGPSHADGIDCKAARGAIEASICADPRLLAQDRDLNRDFAASLARDPSRAAELKRDELAWLRERDATCGKPAEAAARAACLGRFYTKRLAELAPTPAKPKALLIIAPPPAAQVAEPTPPDVLPPPPAVALPEPAATLDAARLPAAERMATLLHVTVPGRFALSAHSATGVALQLVDMLTGPSDTVGQAGAGDGRLDTLLDVGTYKLRAFAAHGATGEVTLTAAPFQDAAPPQTLPLHERLDAELADLQQRRFWLAVEAGAPIRLEAAGRSLAELTLWRNGTDLVPVTPDVRIIEPVAGHPLTDIVLRGTLEPGSYLLSAYGGRPLVWADGAAGQPFHLRAEPSPALTAGAVAGSIGPFGSELFAPPPPGSLLRLDLPQSALVHFDLRGQQSASATITPNTRTPTAWLDVPPGVDPTRLIEVTGAAGQPFQLRAESGAASADLFRPGTWFVTADAAGLGGDEPPPTLLLTRQSGKPPETVVGAVAPRVGPGVAWRQRFNLRGPITVLVEATGAGPVALRADGMTVQASLAPFGSPVPPRADGAKPDTWDLAAGWYQLTLTPPRGAAGIIDVTLGPPGLLPDPSPAQPADPALPLGLITQAPGEVLRLSSGHVGDTRVGLNARLAPVDLAAAPLTLTQLPGAALDVPVRLPGDGILAASEIGGGAVDVTFAVDPAPTAGRIGVARLPAAEHARNVALWWQPPARAQAPVPPPPQPAVLPALTAGTPAFLDLSPDTSHSFTLTVAEGGLLRVETLGRLRTSGSIGTGFIPDLDHADANGVGQNFLIQRFLRAGRYHVQIGSRDSAGRAGITARPAGTVSGATLLPGGSVRAAMPGDAGLLFPVEVPSAGRYHLDLLSLARGLTARLEDAEGWPMLPAGDLSSLDQELAPGHYRLLVQPTGIAARVVARLNKIEPARPHVGHGPFALGFDSTQRATWREPPGRDDARAPDTWRFALAGPAAVTLAISDGMVADLVAAESDARVARFTSAAKYAATLAAGSYLVKTASLGRNDRLDYTLSLASRELQPGVARRVALPASVPFAIATDRVVSLTSFGRIPLRAVLKRADGTVVERAGDRGNDWNIGVSQLLAKGAYTLDLASAAPGRGTPVPPADAPAPANTDQAEDEKSADAPDSASDQGAAMPSQEAETPADQPADDSDTGAPKPTVEVRLAVPAEHPPIAAAGERLIVLTGGGVHHMTLPNAPDGALSVVAASASADLVLALERQDNGGPWQAVSVVQGIAPVVGALDGHLPPGSGWRASVWTLDGGAEPIRLAVRVIDQPAVPLGSVTPLPVPLAGLPQTLAVAHVAVPDLAPLRLAGDIAGIAAASRPYGPLVPLGDKLILPQSHDLWLLARDAPPALTLAPVSVPAGGTLALSIPEGGAAFLPADVPDAGRMRLWRADSGFGQPGIHGGRGMGVAAGSALALAGGGSLWLNNAAGMDALRVTVTPLDLALQPARALTDGFSEAVPPGAVLPLRLPDGVHRIQVNLPPATAAVTNWQDCCAVTAWAGNAAVSRTIEGNVADLLLVNTGATTAPIAVSWTTGDEPPLALRPGMVLKRFFGAAGSLDLPVAGTANAPPLSNELLVVVGGIATLDDDGSVRRGAAVPMLGHGRVILDHGPGLLAVWIEGVTSPWPAPAPQTVTLPQRLPLHDAAMTLALAPATPVLLHARTTAPVILCVGDETPSLFAAGAEWHRYVPSGPLTLRVFSPHDGPLSGTLELSADPVMPAGEGVGATVAVAPGATAAFGFEVAQTGPLGVGVRAQPDRASVRVLDAAGRLRGEGVAQLLRLPPGRYVLEARVPPDATTTLVRPAIIGLAARPNGPPQDIVNAYLEAAGRAPVAGATP